MLNNSEHITFSIQVILKKTTMNKRKICLTAQGNIFKSLAPFYYCLKIFGLACYSLDFDNGNIKVQFLNALNFGVFVSFYSVLVVLSFIKISSIDIDVVNDTISKATIYQFIVQLFLINFIISWNFWNRSVIAKFLKNLNLFDQMILKERFKYKINHDTNRHKFMFWLGLSFIILITNFITTYLVIETGVKRLGQYIFGYYLIQTLSMNIFQFIFSTYAVISRFQVLIQNTKLYLSPNNYEYFWTEAPIAKKSEIVRKITILNNLLHDAIENINSIFSIQCVPNYLLILIGDVLIFYSLALIYKSDAFSSTTVVLFIINNLYQSIPITISIHFGAVVVQMSQQMSIVMGNIITISDDKEVIERVSLFATQNINHMTFMNLIFYS